MPSFLLCVLCKIPSPLNENALLLCNWVIFDSIIISLTCASSATTYVVHLTFHSSAKIACSLPPIVLGQEGIHLTGTLEENLVPATFMGTPSLWISSSEGTRLDCTTSIWTLPRAWKKTRWESSPGSDRTSDLLN